MITNKSELAGNMVYYIIPYQNENKYNVDYQTKENFQKGYDFKTAKYLDYEDVEYLINYWNTIGMIDMKRIAKILQ